MNALEYRVGKISTGDLGALSIHRGRRHWSLRACGESDWWLRVPAGEEDHFRLLPLSGRWSLEEAGKLIRDGRRVPEALLPEDGWLPLATVLPFSPPLRNLPGMAPLPTAFPLVRDEVEQDAGALICRFADFASWADTAIAPRLAGLRFACADDGRAFLTGHPLPSVPGAAFHPAGRLWLPCGWRLPDHVWPELVEANLKLGSNRRALLHPDGSYEELDEENLVPATRAAVRTTMKTNFDRTGG